MCVCLNSLSQGSSLTVLFLAVIGVGYNYPPTRSPRFIIAV